MFGKGYSKTRISKKKSPIVEAHLTSDSSGSSSESETNSAASEGEYLQPQNELATDESIYSIIRPSEVRQEHFDYSWNLDNYNELEAHLLKLNVGALESNETLSDEKFIVKSPTFQCGLMADRLAQWHLELDLTSNAEGTEKYIGLHLLLEKMLWKNDQKANIFVNAQLLDASGRIFESCKSPETISFGPQDQDRFSRYGWKDFITHERFLGNKETLVGNGNKLRLLLRMDIRGSSGPRSMSLIKESTQNAINEKRIKRDPMEILSKEFFETVTMKKQTEDIWRSGRGTDITIQVGNKEFKAHKVILRAGSIVFADMLREKKRNDSPNVLKLEGFEPDIVENLLEYMYTETCPAFNDLTKASELLKLGKHYKVRYLKKNLMESLMNTLCVNNALQTLLFAHAHDAFSYYIEQLTWYCQKHAAAIQRMDTYADLFALEPNFFTNIFKPKTPEPDYFM